MEQEKNKKNVTLIIIIVIVLILSTIILFVVFNKKTIKNIFIKNQTNITSINVMTYNKEDDYINIILNTSNEQDYCAFSISKQDYRTLSFTKMIDGECRLNVPFKVGYVYFKNKDGVVTDPIILTDYIVDFGVKENYYMALNTTGTLINNMLKIGNPEIEITSNNEELIVDNNSFTSSSNINSSITIKNGTLQSKTVNVIYTDTIEQMPTDYNNKKPTLTCHAYNEEEAELLDKILEDRVNEVGYQTRAAVVAVARFITLEFPYKISYFYENGRVSGEIDRSYVDGEGRYYHKGLYLSENKFADIKGTLSGPSIWGCGLTNWEDDPYFGYVPRTKTPNGLDCSGYVTWNLVNAGFDPGDYGAGENLTRYGELTEIDYDLLHSDKVKVGDLIYVWGHIAIIAGIDEDNIYVVESLNTYRHLVMVKYSKSRIKSYFSHIVLMDEYYKEDGKLTNMWY